MSQNQIEKASDREGCAFLIFIVAFMFAEVVVVDRLCKAMVAHEAISNGLVQQIDEGTGQPIWVRPTQSAGGGR